MTEDQIERKVEVMMDRLDKQYMNGSITEGEYQAEIKSINEWATEEIRKASIANNLRDY